MVLWQSMGMLDLRVLGSDGWLMAVVNGSVATRGRVGQIQSTKFKIRAKFKKE